MAAPTPEEHELLPRFREITADLNLPAEESTDLQLLKWIRAREWDLKKANDLLRASLKLRKEKQFDTILEWQPPPEYLTDYDYDIEGRDSEGRPRKPSQGQQRIWKPGYDTLISFFKKMKEADPKYGEVTQFILIEDMEKLSMRQLASFSSLETMRESVRRLESNYPETLYKVYIINASRVFSVLFSCVKPFLTARTLAKINIISSSNKWIPALLETIPKDQLPAIYGGTRDRMFKKPSKDGLPNDCEALQIGAGQKVELKFSIPEPNIELIWKFRLENYDVGFYLNYNLEEELVPLRRYDFKKGKEGAVHISRDQFSG